MYRNRFQEQAHEEIDHIFHTLLPKYGMTVREEQISLCHQMTSALWEGRTALCDAAVGVGKTYAYLTACILFRKYGGMINGNYSMDRDIRPVVISTSSIALQDAVLGEYIPLLSKIFVSEKVIRRPVRAVLRKGKEHFVCDERLEMRLKAVSNAKKNFYQREALQKLCQNYDMDAVEGLSGYDRRMVCVPKWCPAECSRRGDCRYQMFLRQAVDTEIDIQICNHNYLLADAIHRAEGCRPLLKDYQVLVVDEAHKLPETAQQMYGRHLGEEEFHEICSLLEQAKYTHTAVKLREAFRQLLVSVSNLRNETGTQRRKQRQQSGNEPERIVFQPDVRSREALKKCIRILKQAEHTTEGKIPRRSSNLLGENRAILEEFLSGNRNRIFFLEYTGKGVPTFCVMHRRTADMLEQDLWDQGIPAILTSGTLAAGGSFRRIRQTCGLGKCSRVREYTAASPFDYQANVLFYFPADMQRKRNFLDPGIKDFQQGRKYPARNCSREQEQIRQTAEQIRRLVQATFGHTLVLFTSYSMMGSVYRELKGRLPFPVLRVWKDSQRVIREFKEQKNAVLFAAGSCWEGMDFPGDTVSSLILVRLPFPVPDPIREAERGKYDTLQEYIQKIVVPDMQMKLRQGFGRAIRTETDTCVVSVLDERAAPGGRYHKAVMEALPCCPLTESLEEVERFIRQRKGTEYYM